jgi:hypothetical protein
MYLRKSRADNPDETVEEVLAKHEAILQEWALRELGHEISEECIYREVVSGESIAERVKIQKILSMIENPNVVGVVCVDPQRLSRGDLLDCGTLINTFMYSSTLVATPMMTYDLSNKMERRFFQDELMRGRDYLDYVKEVLNRGKIAAVKKGNYIFSKPAFGYDKVTIGKDHTLVPNKDADVVRMIFDWYVNERVGYQEIANRLDDMGVKPVSTDRWLKNTIANMLRNIQYDGKVCYNRRPSVITIKDGERKVTRHLAAEEDMIIVEGKHPAIVDHDLFMAAQQILNNNPRVKSDRELRNAFAGILVCSQCKKGIYFNGYGGHRDPRLECRRKPPHFKSAKYTDVVRAVISALEESELPNLEALRKNNAGSSVAIQQQILKNLEEEMKGYHEQEETQYELLETKKYTQELFDKRNAALRQRMNDCEARIKKARLAMPNAINYEEKVVQLKSAIAALKDDSVAPEKTNRILKEIIEKIYISTTDGGVNNTEIHLKIFLNI